MVSCYLWRWVSAMVIAATGAPEVSLLVSSMAFLGGVGPKPAVTLTACSQPPSKAMWAYSEPFASVPAK